MDQADLLRYVIDVLEDQQVTYMLVGSIASAAYGEPRFTLDIDIVVELNRSQLDTLCNAFPEPQYSISRVSAEQAIRGGGQFNIIDLYSGGKIDFMIARRDPWGIAQIAGRQRISVLPDRAAYAARPEDVILGKMWYYQIGESEKHIRDIVSILRLAEVQIDHEYIEHWADQLGLVEVWSIILGRLGSA